MTSEEKMREEFEAWLSSLKFVAGQGQDHVAYCLHRDLSDIYTVEWVCDMWRGWKASRESLVIELTTGEQFEPMGISVRIGYDRAIADCRESIHAAGVKTK